MSILDSGGGSLFHLGPAVIKLFIWRLVRPAYRDAYCTAFGMPCDADWHAMNARLWVQSRQMNAELRLGAFLALRMIRHVMVLMIEDVPVIKKSSEKCGWVEGQPTGVNAILVDRAGEVLRFQRPDEDEIVTPGVKEFQKFD